MKTILLDRTTWDLCLDTNGNLAVASDPYSIAQDVASACRLFLGEAYYDTTQGVPYFEKILGKNPPLSVLKAALVQVALTVPEVASAVVYVSARSDRSVEGQIQVTTTSGTTVVIGGPLNNAAPLPT